MRSLMILAITFVLISSAVSQDPKPTKTTELNGSIRVDGKPLEKGRILFYSRDGQIVGSIIRDGKYKIDKPNTGEQIVTIDGLTVPMRYGDSEKSGLICEVTPEINNRVDFELTSK